MFSSSRCYRQHLGDRGGDYESSDAQHNQRAHPQPGLGRPPLHRLLCPLHRHGLLAGQVAIRTRLVPGEKIDDCLNLRPRLTPVVLFSSKAVQYLIYVTSYVSIYTLILMSFDRFLAVVFPV